MFPGGLRASIDQALADVPTGKTGAVTVDVTKTGGQIGFGWKPNDNVTVGAFGAKTWGGGWTAGATAKVTW